MKTRIVRHLAATLIFGLLAAGLLPSCTKESNADADTLLSTIPSGAAMAVVVNGSEILDELGSKQENLPQPYQDILESATRNSMAVKAFLDPESGMSKEVMVIFSERTDIPIATGMLDDPAKFKNYIQTATGREFEADGDAERCGLWTLRGNQYWFGPGVDGAMTSRLTSLAANESLASQPIAKELCDADHSINYYAQTDAVLSNLRGSDRFVAKMVLNTLFKDLNYLSGYAKMDKKGIKGELGFFTEKGEKAQYLLPTPKVDPKEIEALGGTANFWAAVGCNKALVEKVNKLLSSAGSGMPEEMLSALAGIDGTIALAMSPNKEVNFIIGTDGKNTASLLNSLNTLAGKGMSMVREGDNIIGRQDGKPTTGSYDAKDAAAKLKGSIIGVYGVLPDHSTPENAVVTLKLEPSGSSLELEYEAALR